MAAESTAELWRDLERAYGVMDASQHLDPGYGGMGRVTHKIGQAGYEEPTVADPAWGAKIETRRTLDEHEGTIDIQLAESPDGGWIPSRLVIVSIKDNGGDVANSTAFVTQRVDSVSPPAMVSYQVSSDGTVFNSDAYPISGLPELSLNGEEPYGARARRAAGLTPTGEGSRVSTPVQLAQNVARRITVLGSRMPLKVPEANNVSPFGASNAVQLVSGRGPVGKA